jgi:nitrite reductase (cytochrome c-552)
MPSHDESMPEGSGQKEAIPQGSGHDASSRGAQRESKMKRRVFYIGTIVVVALATAGAMLLGQSVMERRAEGERAVFNVAKLDETVVDPEIWGQNFPRQYDGYLRTADIERTRFGGSEAFDKLEADPNLRTIFAGYGFALEFNEERGHYYTLFDQEESARVTELDQPGSCLQCHASNTLAYYEAGVAAGADPAPATAGFDDPRRLEAVLQGFRIVNAKPYEEANALVEHPVSCIDCHDPQTMDLRVTKPGFILGIRELADSEYPLPHLPSIEEWREGARSEPYDPNALASRQEMRAMVCGQCHVEYYFKGEDKQLTYPWDDGVAADQILSYYDYIGFSDWTHAISGAGVLKAQHPEFELWNSGVHARSGVSCADCHMPYEREGALKISNHQVRSPLLNASAACGTCHPYSESEIVARAETIQARTREILDLAEDATVDLIERIAAAMEAGATDDMLEEARGYQRTAQFYTDFINAENSMGFHSPQEAARVLALALDAARLGTASVDAVMAELAP